MSQDKFMRAVYRICELEPRFRPEAYQFLNEALDFTMKREAAKRQGRMSHVSGEQVLEGFRDCALEKFGPMAATLMREWGLQKCRDVGTMVYLLIDAQIYSAQESDSIEDFQEFYSFSEAFRQPFLARD